MPLKPSEAQYRRFPLFSHRPIQGAIGFDGWFQIVPAPADAPQPSNGWGDYVGVLEVKVDGSPLPMIVGKRAYRQARIIELLLAALTTGGFHLSSGSSRSFWVLDPSDEWRPKHMQQGYSFDGIAGTISEFSDISPLESIELVETNTYYANRSQGASDASILPETFPFLIQKFNSLSPDGQDKTLRAAYWIKHSEEVWPLSRSAAFIALVSAIECLLPSDLEIAPPCSNCGRTTSAGPTQRFADFVDSLVKDAVPRKQRLEFYNRRSRMVHGNRIARNDDFDLASVDPLRLSEDGEHRWLSAICELRFTIGTWPSRPDPHWKLAA